MKIEILGSGCQKCIKTMENVKEAVKKSGIQAEVVKVTKINDIMNYGVMVTPALVIDGNVKVAGRIPTTDEIQKWISEEK
jgi:small redox-active disulfide protein 2